MHSWERMYKNFDKRLEHEEIDEFVRHLNASLDRRIKHDEERIKNITEDDMEDPRDLDAYRDHLIELSGAVYAAKDLGHELSIIALYKKVESHVCKVVSRKVPAAEGKNLVHILDLKRVLPFDMASVMEFDAYNELRLINNAIKHGGKVTRQLSEEYPVWVVGEELSDLGASYDRLLPRIKVFVSALVEKLYAVQP